MISLKSQNWYISTYTYVYNILKPRKWNALENIFDANTKVYNHTTGNCLSIALTDLKFFSSTLCCDLYDSL